MCVQTFDVDDKPPRSTKAADRFAYNFKLAAFIFFHAAVLLLGLMGATRDTAVWAVLPSVVSLLLFVSIAGVRRLLYGPPENPAYGAWSSDHEGEAWCSRPCVPACVCVCHAWPGGLWLNAMLSYRADVSVLRSRGRGSPRTHLRALLLGHFAPRWLLPFFVCHVLVTAVVCVITARETRQYIHEHVCVHDLPGRSCRSIRECRCTAGRARWPALTACVEVTGEYYVAVGAMFSAAWLLAIVATLVETRSGFMDEALMKLAGVITRRHGDQAAVQTTLAELHSEMTTSFPRQFEPPTRMVFPCCCRRVSKTAASSPLARRSKSEEGGVGAEAAAALAAHSETLEETAGAAQAWVQGDMEEVSEVATDPDFLVNLLKALLSLGTTGLVFMSAVVASAPFW